MSMYGAKYLQWAPIVEEPADSKPTYGQAINLGPLVKVADSPTYNEAKSYGDDVLQEYVNEFNECPVDVEVTELPMDAAAAITGAKLEGESEQKDLAFGANDNAPHGGLGFYISKQVKGVKSYQGVFYSKLKASMQGEEYSTKAGTVTLVNSKMRFLAMSPSFGPWKVKSPGFATETEAKAWVDAKLAAAAATGA